MKVMKVICENNAPHRVHVFKKTYEFLRMREIM